LFGELVALVFGADQLFLGAIEMDASARSKRIGNVASEHTKKVLLHRLRLGDVEVGLGDPQVPWIEKAPHRVKFPGDQEGEPEHLRVGG
jgi:hypothetical protein